MENNKAWHSCFADFILEKQSGTELFMLALAKESDLIYRDGMFLVDEFHQNRQKLMAQLPQKEHGYLSCRVRRKELGVRIVWMIQNPIPKRKRYRSGPTVFSDEISKPASKDSYARSRVITPECKPYEGQLFDFYEPKFTVVRARSKRLGKILRLCGNYRKFNNQKWIHLLEGFYDEE